MNVLLVRAPSILPPGIGQASSTCPPIGLAYIAASIREAGHRVTGIDSIGEAPLKFSPSDKSKFVFRGLTPQGIAERAAAVPADVIGCSIMFTHEWPQAKRTLRLLRQVHPNAIIMAGGEHITGAPELSLQDCPELDVCVLGEGEETAVNLVNAVEKRTSLHDVNGIVFRDGSRILRTSPRSRIRSIDSIPPPDWTVFPIEPYLDNELGFGVNRGRSMPVLATRGCPYECTFCSSPFMWTTRWLARNPDAVLDEMEESLRKYRVSNFDFYDLTAIIKRDWIIDFCKKMVDRNMKCTWQLPSGTRSEAVDREVVDWMYRAGCRDVSYAPESGSPDVLKRIKKKVKLDRMLASMKDAVDAGMNVKCNIIIGFPGEKHRHIMQTMLFLFRMARAGVHDIHLNGYLAYPGAELFHELQEKGLFRTLDDDYCYSLVEENARVTSGISHSENISHRMLAIYRFIGLVLFYSTRYFLKPRDLKRMVANIAAGREETRGQHEIINLIKRWKANKSVEI
jgi:radical SAM superfamily enzyme YgiQ (UPF0313 family)